MRLALLGLILAFTSIFLVGAYAQPSTIELTETNYIGLLGEVNTGNIEFVMNEIKKSDPTKPLFLFIDSPGGSVFAGKRLADYLSTTTRPIHCVANVAISMAFVIYESCPVRLVTPRAVLMMHHISSGAQGTIEDINHTVTVMQKLEDLIFQGIANRLLISKEELVKKIGFEWWTMGGNNAVDANLSDDVIKVRCSTSLEKNGKCPLF